MTNIDTDKFVITDFRSITFEQFDDFVKKEELLTAPLRQIKIISFKDKDQWELCPKYNIGNK